MLYFFSALAPGLRFFIIPRTAPTPLCKLRPSGTGSHASLRYRARAGRGAQSNGATLLRGGRCALDGNFTIISCISVICRDAKFCVPCRIAVRRGAVRSVAVRQIDGTADRRLSRCSRRKTGGHAAPRCRARRMDFAASHALEHLILP